MADNPNKGSARINSQGSGAPRRGGAPGNPRLLDFIDGERIQFRNPNVPSRSNGRNRPERSQTAPNNRNRFEKQPSTGNRNRYDRPPNMRNRSDRFSADGSYPGRLFYAQNFEPASGERPKPHNEHQNFCEHRCNQQNGSALTNNDSSASDINNVDEGTNGSAKCNNNLEELCNWNFDGNSEDTCDMCQWQLTPHVHLPTPVQIAKNVSQRLEMEPGNHKTEQAKNNQKYALTFEDPEQEEFAKMFTPIDPNCGEMFPFSPDTLYLPPGRSCLRTEKKKPVSDSSQLTGNTSNNTEVATSQTKSSPRPIKGRTYTHFPQDSGSGVLRPITKRNVDNADSSETKSNLPHTVTSGTLDEEWVNAPEFYPKSSKPKSYAEAVHPKTGLPVVDGAEQIMCPLVERAGVCKMMPHCPYLHGDTCELCGAAALHPTDSEQRKQHHQKCLERHEKDMELSFAIARSKEKTCGICFEVVIEKEVHERRFGILTKCNHCFCLTCIRKWRQARQFENKVVRACPECRVTSDFVCPSLYWVETKEEKDKLIENYKNALAEKECKYFKQGRGSCPFGNKCFYLHALPDGTKTDVGPPPRRRRNRNRHHDDGELGDMLQQIILWDFLDEHDHHWLYSFADDLEDLVAFFSDSDDSEWSEYEYLLD